MPLRSRSMQIPGGLRYIQPDTNWRTTPWASLDRIVDEVIAHRQGNPHLITTNGWSIDRKTVENEVDEYNSRICQSMNWMHFLQEGAVAGPQSGPFLQAPGKQPRSLLNSAKNVAVGSQILVEWIKTGAEAVPIAQASKRAEVCSLCPKNVSSDLTSLFTIPAAAAIKAELNRRKEMKLETPFDENLGVCSACFCPMRLKVHVPFNSFIHKMTSESVAQLDPFCWILSEQQGREPVIEEIKKAREANARKL